MFVLLTVFSVYIYVCIHAYILWMYGMFHSHTRVHTQKESRAMPARAYKAHLSTGEVT